MASIDDIQTRIQYYRRLHEESPSGRYRGYPRWRGRLLIKFPQDMILYAQTIWQRKPEIIIETGTWFGGSALFFGDMMLLSGGKQVISVDLYGRHQPSHPFVEYVVGSSTDRKVFDHITKRVERLNGPVMVVLDSDHSEKHVLRELELYSKLVKPGQFIVVEDCWTKHRKPYPPYYAVQRFLESNGNEFELKHPENQFVFAVSRDGWLLRKG